MFELDPADVRSVLRHLSRDRAPRRTPLADLELVRSRLAGAGFQQTPEACLYEIGHLMTQVVENELRHLRSRNPDPDSQAQPPVGAARVLADFRCGDQDLECWSAVYHVYLRPDLRLDLRSLERLLADRHRRTIQRRLKSGTERLAVRLQALERDARKAARRHQLAASVPATPPEGPTGVDSLVDHVLGALHDSVAGQSVALGGPPGIGKTTAAVAVVGRESRDGSTHEPIWITASDAVAIASTTGGLLAEVAARCDLQRNPQESPDPVAPDAVRIVVVDGLDDMPSAIRICHAVGRITEPFRVLLTGRVCWSAIPSVRSIAVPPLDDAYALRMLRHELARRGLHDAARAQDTDLLPVVKAGRGIPLLLAAAAGELRLADAPSVGRSLSAGTGVFAGLAERLWSRQWWSVGEPARQASELVMAAEKPEHAPAFDDLSEAWARDRLSLANALREALDAGLLSTSGQLRRRRYRSMPLLSSYVVRLAGSLSASPSPDLSSPSIGPCP